MMRLARVSTLLEVPACVLQEIVQPGALPPLLSREYWLRARPREAESLSAARRHAADSARFVPDRERLLRLGVRDGRGATAINNVGGTAIGTRLLLSDEAINVWEFALAPGEECAYHTHGLPYFFTNLTASLTLALARDGTPVGEPTPQRAGQTTLVSRASLPAGHGVKNVGDERFLQFVVEFKRCGAAESRLSS